MTGFPPWQDYDRAALDVQYSPSSRVASLQAYLDEYEQLSAAARRAARVHVGLRFGPQEWELLDLFPGPAADAALVVFIHGGNWQALSRTESSFIALAALRAGAAFAAVDYGLAPHTDLEQMVAAVARSVTWLARQAGRFGFSPRRIHVAGTSAGAHLVAAALLTAPAAHPAVAGCVLLSGIYDLEPVRHSYVNDALRLDAARARRLSPIHHLAAVLPPVIVARGYNETDEYGRQHDDMIAALGCRTQVDDVIAVGRNHFDLPYDLVAADTALGDAALRKIGRS